MIDEFDEVTRLHPTNLPRFLRLNFRKRDYGGGSEFRNPITNRSFADGLVDVCRPILPPNRQVDVDALEETTQSRSGIRSVAATAD